MLLVMDVFRRSTRTLERSGARQMVWRLDRGGAEPDREVVVQRSKAVGQAVRSAGRADLVIVHDGSGVRSYLSVPTSTAGPTVARALSAAVGASTTDVDELPDLAAPVVGLLRANPQSSASRETAAGADPLESASTLARELAPGEWLAVSLRAPHRGETKRVRAWYRARLAAQTHSTLDPEVLVASISAGATSRERAASHMTQVASAMPGFDIEVKPLVPRRYAAAAALILVTALLWFGVAWLTGSALTGEIAALIPAVAAGIDLAGWPLGRRWRAVARARAGRFVAPPRRWLSPRAPRAAMKREDGSMTSASNGSYPLDGTAFLFGPGVFVGVAAPRAEGLAGATRLREPSPTTLERIGPMIGTAGSRQLPVHLSASDLSSGVAILGIPDSGKSVLARLIYGWVCLERIRPSGLPGWPGRNSAVIAFENKGQGAARYQAWAASVGDTAILVDVASPTGPRIDLFAGPGGVRERAARFIDHMVYGFPDGAVQGESTESLTAVIQGALAIPYADVAEAGLGRLDNEIVIAHALLGGQGDDVGKRLYEILERARSDAKGTPAFNDLEAATRSLAVFYGDGQSASSRRASFKAARNKMDALVTVGSFWSHDRPALRWDQILTGHLNVIVNTGVSTDGHQMTDKSVEFMSGMLLHALRGAISRNCFGWLAGGRSVWLFGDELKLLAASGSEVIEWTREQGREFGVKPVFASQRPDQLRPDVRSSLMGFGTMGWFSQNSAGIIDEAVRDLGTDGTVWSAADIAAVRAHHALIRTTVGKHRQPGVPVKIAYFEDDLTAFPAAQGYPAFASTREVDVQW